MLELVSTFSKVNSLNIKYEFEPRRKGDIPFLVADNSLALNLLNWFPKRNLEDMCIDSFKWMKQNKNSKILKRIKLELIKKYLDSSFYTI